MKIIKAERLVHKNEIRIVLKFPYDALLIGLVKELDDARWSSGMSWKHTGPPPPPSRPTAR